MLCFDQIGNFCGNIMRSCAESIFVGGFVAEFVFFLYKTAYSMLEPSIKLYIYQSRCLEMFPNETSICMHLSQFPIHENYIQKAAAQYLVIYKVLVNVPAILLGFFCGSWSDKIGRKIPMMLPCFGCMLAVLLYMSSQIYGKTNATPYILIGATVNGLFGKSAVITMAVHSYASDVSGTSNRTRKIGRLVSMNFFGQFLGSLLVGIMLDTTGFEVLFCVVIVINSIAVLVVIFCLKETVPLANAESKPSEHPNLLHHDHIRNSLNVLFKPRMYNARTYLIILVSIVIINQACKTGEIDVTLLFVQHRPLSWIKSTYGYLLAWNNASIGLCLFFILPCLSHRLKLSDVNIVIIAVCVKIFRLLFNAFSRHTWMLFFAATIDAIAGMIVSTLKALISKIVSEDEFGKCFSLISSGETASNLIGSLVFNSIYAVTFEMMPGFVFIVEAFVFVLLLLLLIWLAHDMSKTAHYKIMNEVADVNKPEHDGYEKADGEDHSARFLEPVQEAEEGYPVEKHPLPTMIEHSYQQEPGYQSETTNGASLHHPAVNNMEAGQSPTRQQLR